MPIGASDVAAGSEAVVTALAKMPAFGCSVLRTQIAWPLSSDGIVRSNPIASAMNGAVLCMPFGIGTVPNGALQ